MPRGPRQSSPKDNPAGAFTGHVRRRLWIMLFPTTKILPILGDENAGVVIRLPQPTSSSPSCDPGVSSAPVKAIRSGLIPTPSNSLKSSGMCRNGGLFIGTRTGTARERHAGNYHTTRGMYHLEANTKKVHRSRLMVVGTPRYYSPCTSTGYARTCRGIGHETLAARTAADDYTVPPHHRKRSI